MVFHYIPALEIFMAILGFGFTIVFCTAFCRACHRFREQQMERQAERPPSVYFIPFPRSVSLPQGEDLYRPPPYSAAPPPSYNELGLKPEDLPPAYGEYVGVSICPMMTTTTPPPPLVDMVHPRAH